MRSCLVVGLLALPLLVACAQAPSEREDAEQPELAPELKSLVLEQAPSDIAHPLYVDFNGKAELVGYSLEPQGTAAPGSKLALKLYWRASDRLAEGYALFTELVTPDGRRIDVTGSGPVRSGALSPANWQPSKVYVDEQEVVVPSDINASRFAIVVGFKTQPVAAEQPAPGDSNKADKNEKAADAAFGAVYLSVLSGPADKHGAVLSTVETGITPGAQRALTGKDGKRAAGKIPMGTKPPSAKPAR